MLLFAIVMVSLAFVFYTGSIWVYVIKRKLYSLIVAAFGVGFACDVAGTIAMMSLRSGSSMSAHGFFAWFAMMLMLVLLIILMVAYYEEGTIERWVRTFAFCAWVFWVASFLSVFV